MTVSKTLRELLGPSPFAADGFLGSEDRAPEDIIQADLAALRGLHATKEAVAAALRDVLVKAQRAMGNPIVLSGSITAVHHEARGQIPSPFPGEGSFEKGEVAITNSANVLVMLITPLSIHLIEKHGFFQGKGSRFRIEPQEAVALMKSIGEKP